MLYFPTPDTVWGQTDLLPPITETPIPHALACTLSPMAKLFLWSSRSMISGMASQETIMQRLQHELGAAAGAVMAQQFCFLKVLATSASRQLKISRPCCPRLGDDEKMLLECMGLLERGDNERARLHLASLLGCEVPEGLLKTAEHMAFLFSTPIGQTEGCRILH